MGRGVLGLSFPQARGEEFSESFGDWLYPSGGACPHQVFSTSIGPLFRQICNPSEVRGGSPDPQDSLGGDGWGLQIPDSMQADYKSA